MTMHIQEQETEKTLHHLVDNASVLMLYFDTHGNLSLCNKKIEAVTGKSKKDIIGKYWLAILYGKESAAMKPQMFKAVVEDCLTRKRSNNFEGAILDAQSKERIISWRITPIFKDSGELEGTLLIGNDITELKESEASLKKIDETLKNIFSSIKEYALYVINLNGYITYYGMGAEILFGWQKNDIVFKHVAILHKKEDAENKLPAILEKVKQSGQYESEVDLLRKNGESFPVSLTVSQFKDTEGSLIGYIFMAKDITERKRLEHQIFQSEKLAAIGQLAAGMAHEINNPLFVISGKLEIMLAENGLNEKMRESLGLINAQADRIRKLVDNLLEFARKKPLEMKMLSINEVINNVLPLLDYHKLATSGIGIKKELDEALPLIKGDLHQLQEVFVNLLVNAYHAMPHGGTVTIKTSNPDRQYAQIMLSDTGHGIKEHNLRNIFMPFFSTKKNGTGLGLSICYNIIKNHNGSIEVESQMGKGTTFIIKLPFA
jgi:PAS domain S-box-containing protein